MYGIERMHLTHRQEQSWEVFQKKCIRKILGMQPTVLQNAMPVYPSDEIRFATANAACGVADDSPVQNIIPTTQQLQKYDSN